MDGGAWWATVHGVTKSQTRLSDFTIRTLTQKDICTSTFIAAVFNNETTEKMRYMCMYTHTKRHDRATKQKYTHTHTHTHIVIAF